MFTPVHSFFGATLLCLASQQYLSLNKTFGCSSILSGPFLDPKNALQSLQVQALSGLLLGSYLINRTGLIPWSSLATKSHDSLLMTAIAGLLVGSGTKLANGCTSGHMLNGLARCSKRSLVATITFFSTAVLTVYLLDTAPHSPGNYTLDPSDSDGIPQLLGTIMSLFAISGLIRLTESPSLIAFNAGVNFASGLCISGMSLPSKTLGFLNLCRLESFDPSLLMIVLGGLLPNFLIHLKQGTRVTNTVVDARLIIGSAMFGVGWGLHVAFGKV